MAAARRVLFLCTGNSCRSQMAEGWCRAMHGSSIVAQSAGTRPQGLNPLAVRAMAEVGIDITGHASKHVDSFRGEEFDLVVTVCEKARESCPVLPGARVVHASFEDPPHMARHARSDDEAITHYRRVRDEIGAFIRTVSTLLANERS